MKEKLYKNKQEIDKSYNYELANELGAYLEKKKEVFKNKQYCSNNKKTKSQ